jgi:hypothetical protein
MAKPVSPNEFKIQKQTVRIPTEFVVINGQRFSYDYFDTTIKALEALDPKDNKHYPVGIERRELRHLLQQAFDADWVKLWSERGVITPYNHDWDNDGHTVVAEMVKAGPTYKFFMKSVKAFQAQRSIERDQAHLEVRRATLKRQLQDLDKPAKARKGAIKNPYYGAIFEV